MTAPAQPAQHAPSHPARRGPVLVALMTAMALAAMDNTIVATAIPQVVRDIGWPLASALSAKLFLRVGFRDTQLTGAVICLVAVAAFLLAPDPAPLWQPVLDTFLLGAGLGLLSVATIVGPQATVSWGQRGVVTGTVMFSRYLGQSLGAAIFGAIFNATLASRLRQAPGALHTRLPG